MEDQSLEHALTVRIGELEERIKDLEHDLEQSLYVTKTTLDVRKLEEENKKFRGYITLLALELALRDKTCSKIILEKFEIDLDKKENN